MTDPSAIHDAWQAARQEGRGAEAEALLLQLHAEAPASRESLTLKLSACIERGDYLDTLHLASRPEGERFPELKALALYFLDDPLWRGIAQGLADDANPHVAAAMRKLLEDAPAGA
ncbi:MAG: HrpB1 family type III secretion system apparatus protein [Burkholderia sp.]